MLDKLTIFGNVKNIKFGVFRCFFFNIDRKIEFKNA